MNTGAIVRPLSLVLLLGGGLFFGATAETSAADVGTAPEDLLCERPSTDFQPGEELYASALGDEDGAGGMDEVEAEPAGTCGCPPAAPGWTASTICDQLGVQHICEATKCVHWDIQGNTKKYDCVFTPSQGGSTPTTVRARP